MEHNWVIVKMNSREWNTKDFTFSHRSNCGIFKANPRSIKYPGHEGSVRYFIHGEEIHFLPLSCGEVIMKDVLE